MQKDLHDDDRKYTQSTCMVKDQLIISDFAWAAMSKLLDSKLPTIYYIRK